MAITRSGTYSQLKGSTIKMPCLVATTGNVDLSAGNCPTTVDGVGVVAGDRVLVVAQSTGSANGIYYVVSSGTWARAIDMSISEDTFRGVQIYINAGDTKASKLFVLTTADPITLNTTSLTFTEVSFGGGTPFGSDGFIQFNSGSTFSGSTNLIWDNHTNRLGIRTSDPIYTLDVRGSSTTDMVSSDIGFNVRQVTDPTSISGVVSAGGSVDTGTHYYSVTFVTDVGQTHPYIIGTPITTTAGNNTVTVTFPVSTDPRVTGRKLYRTKAGVGSYADYLLTTINDNTTTEYVDTAADSTLVASTGAYFRTNTTANNITVNNVKSLTVDIMGTYLGYNAGASMTTGGRNVYIGQYAGDGATTATDVVAVGHQAGSAVITDGNHVFIGSYAGAAITSAQHDTLIGYGSGTAMTSSGLNVGVGYDTMGALTTNAHGNTAIGYRAGRFIGTGSTTSLVSSTYSVFLGHFASSSADGQTNQIVLGNSTVGNGSNTVTIGNSSIIRNYFKGLLNFPQRTIASLTETGVTGDFCWDSNYIYVCMATNTWKKSPLNTDSVESRDSGYTITLSDANKSFTCNSTIARTFYLPSVSSTEIGYEYSFVKLGTGQVTIVASDSDIIQDSGEGMSVYCSDAGIANITLQLVTSTLWIIKFANGTWVTTV